MKNDNETPKQSSADENAMILDVLSEGLRDEVGNHQTSNAPTSADSKESEGQFETMYHLELFAHNQTKAALKEAQVFVKRANEMGFTGGGGIHKGA